MSIESKLKRIEDFRAALVDFREDGNDAVRTFINQNISAVRREVLEAGCMKTYTISPPPVVGGMVMQNVDPFTIIFNPPWGRSVIPDLLDMLDETIGVLQDPDYEASLEELAGPTPVSEPVQEGYVFIAMPMSDGRGDYDDVHDAIKEAARRCGLHAERVDEVQSNDRITDRLLESIRRAEYVVADLTDARPNVFYEAGYAHGLGKIPIYVARAGTSLEFDLKDYPVIFFRSMRELRERLEKRLRGLAAAS